MATSWLTYANAGNHDSTVGPDYFRDQFPYTLPPLVQFEREPVPLDPDHEIWVTDTTFRDGQQSRAPYSPDQIVHLYSLLSRLGGSKGMVRQSEFFLYTKKDREAVQRCQDLGYRFPEITGWIRGTLADYQLVRSAGLKETGILTSISDYHIFKKLNSTREAVVANYLQWHDGAEPVGCDHRCHIVDSTRADFYHVVLPFVQTLMERGKQAGIQVKVRYPDTMGVGASSWQP